ncbi:hypothetical protein [Absidia glauca]|uniref:RING-type domain-containing protein n=1 Tax=Absidia glauca TaxID=4829 RepID=A0A163KA38_ABSGL|nr:hypothetical protein [Absidia glauca]
MPQMNCKKDILLDAHCPELLCGLCGDILDDPMQVHCSEDHMFCRTCLANYHTASCPSCMEPIEKATFQLSKFVKRQISRLRVRCINRPSGCTWEGHLEDDHSQTCCYRSVSCPNLHLGCPEVVKVKDLDQHQTECLYNMIPCPNGSTECQPFLRKDGAYHDSSCSSFHCLYAHAGCTFVGTLPEVNRHCENYCGKLHDRLRYLELQCSQLKQQLNQTNDTSSMDTLIANTSNNKDNDKDNDNFMAPADQDSSMDEMALFHQMFTNNFLSVTAEKNADSPNTTDMMDLSVCLPLPLSTSPANQQKQQKQQKQPKDSSNLAPPTTLFSSASSTPTISAPKRSSNGKIIRYSKNKQLAHGALRMARQRSSSGSGLTTQSILDAMNNMNKDDEDLPMYTATNPPPMTPSPSLPVPSTNLDTAYTTHPSPSASATTSVAPRSNSTAASKPNGSITNPPFSFKNLEDVTKFLEELPPVETTPPFLPPQQLRKSGSKSKPKDDQPGGKATTTKPSNDKPMATGSSKPTEPSTAPPRPMYVLASTLLSKHTQDN